jgi:thioredoxin reductase
VSSSSTISSPRKCSHSTTLTMSRSCDVTIIGAGPYALSIAAHLRAKGIDFRMFGSPMHSWKTCMPAGMFLKSEGFASSLYDPDGYFTLKHFCNQKGFAYKDTALPVPLSTFIDYGLAFQQRFVPDLEQKQVVDVSRLPNGEFLIRLDDNETVVTRRVVVAVGISYFPFVPSVLSGLPSELLSHSSEHRDFTRFKGNEVTVLGGGASALDAAAALHKAGAEVQILTRRFSLRWTMAARRPLWKRWYPKCGLGPGWRNRFYEYAPMLFRLLPRDSRLKLVRTWLGPSGAWPVRDLVEKLPLSYGLTPVSAQRHNSRVSLVMVGSDGEKRQLTADHVIAATGYKVDLRKIAFLNENLRAQLKSFDSEPVLSANFESSIPELYFVGLASSLTFGPLMRFALGARYAARRLAWHLSKTSPRNELR